MLRKDDEKRKIFQRKEKRRARCLKRVDATSIFRKIVKKVFKSRRKKISYAKDFLDRLYLKKYITQEMWGCFSGISEIPIDLMKK